MGGVMGFGSGCGYPNLCGAVGSSSTSSTTTPVVQLSGSGANLPVVTGAAARNPLSYITPANPQGSGGTIPYTPYHLPIQNGWQWTAGVQRRLPGNMVAEGQYVGSHWGNMMFEADVNQLPANKLGQGPDGAAVPAVLRHWCRFRRLAHRLIQWRFELRVSAVHASQTNQPWLGCRTRLHMVAAV